MLVSSNSQTKSGWSLFGSGSNSESKTQYSGEAGAKQDSKNVSIDLRDKNKEKTIDF